MKLQRVLLTTALVLLFASTLSAQKASPPAKGEASKVATAPSTDADTTKPKAQPGKDDALLKAEEGITRLQQRALSMIREAAADAVTLEDRRTIARVQSRAASAIWKFDVDDARQLFEKAFETAVTHYRETKNSGRIERPDGSSVSLADVRQEVIRAVTKCDPALAKTMTERFIEEKSREIAESQAKGTAKENALNDNPLMGKPDPAAENLLNLAFSLLETDREASIGLARRALERSIPTSAASYFARLGNLDRGAADRLYREALGRLLAQETPVPAQLLVLAAYPFGEGRIFISDGNSSSSMGFGKPAAFELDPQIWRSFFEVAVQLLARTSQLNTGQFPELVTRINSGLFAARYLEPKVTQYEPALSEKWAALTSALYGAASEASRAGVGRRLESLAREERPMTASDTEDRIKSQLDQAEKTSDFVRRDEQYAQAAMTARQAGDMPRALSIADRVSDMEFRQSLRDWLNFDASSAALSAQRIDEAQKYALDISAADQRAYILFQIAAMLVKERNNARAIDLLEEATRGALAAENTAHKLRALLGIANAYAPIDPTRAFEIASEAMKVASKVSDYGPDFTNLSRSLKRKGGTSANYSTSTADGFDVGKALSTLARSDLERALSLAQSIDNKPLQLLTVVAVATTLLESK